MCDCPGRPRSLSPPARVQSFLNFWGVVFIVTTIVVLGLRLREPEEDEHDREVSAKLAETARGGGGGGGNVDGVRLYEGSAEETDGLLAVR